MKIIEDQSSLWLVEFDKQLLRCKQTLLYGNVSDDYLLNGEYVSIRQFMSRYFQEAGYALVAFYDPVDGMTFAAPEMRATFDQTLIGTSLGASPARPRRRPMEEPQRTGPGGPPPSTLGGAFPAPPSSPLPSAPDQALPMLRTLLRQNQLPTAVVLDFSDKLVGDPQHQTGPELPILILLKKMIQEAALLNEGASVGIARHRRNVLVILAEQLSGIPTWIYQDNPLLAVVPIPRPRRKERVAFASQYLNRFTGGSGLIGDERKKVVEDLADLTDGLSMHDLNSVRLMSEREKIPVVEPKKLVDYYKFGVNEDPWASLDPNDLREARTTLRNRVIGQDHAVEAVVDMLISAQVGLTLADGGKGTKPKGIFFFVGPTGVGKTELAKGLTEVIFKDASAFARFDMSEYALEHAAEKFTGSPPGFVGYEEGGQLTNRVLEKPFSLLLFDEIEKAHGKIMDKFLQILEDGRLTDSRGQTADFSQSVIIFTSNIGSDSLGTITIDPKGLPDYQEVQKHFKKSVRDHFARPVSENGLGRPELFNRLGDNVLVFDLLRPEYIRSISLKFQRTLIANAREQKGISLEFERDEIAQLIVRLMLENPDNLQMGGRRVRTLLEDVVLKRLNRYIFERKLSPGAALKIGVAENGDAVVIH